MELACCWFNRFRKLAPRYEKTDVPDLILNVLAAAMITFNKASTMMDKILISHPL